MTWVETKTSPVSPSKTPRISESLVVFWFITIIR
ncbi:unnamed protein product [Brassica oleracea]